MIKASRRDRWQADRRCKKRKKEGNGKKMDKIEKIILKNEEFKEERKKKRKK